MKKKQVYRVKEFCESYGISRASLYREMAAGRISTVKRGKTTLITSTAANKWVRNLPSNTTQEEPRKKRKYQRRRKTFSIGAYIKLIIRKLR